MGDHRLHCNSHQLRYLFNDGKEFNRSLACVDTRIKTPGEKGQWQQQKQKQFNLEGMEATDRK